MLRKKISLNPMDFRALVCFIRIFSIKNGTFKTQCMLGYQIVRNTELNSRVSYPVLSNL